TGTDPYASLTLGTTPAGYIVTLVDNAGFGTVDVSITPTAAPSTPQISSISISGATLHLSATNGNNNAPFTLLGSTNVTLPLNQWTTVLTNSFDGSGNVNLTTNVVDPSVSREFFILRVP